jgi:PST family polysaccharide transporter
MGRPDILNNISISTIVFTIFALWVGAHYGIVGVAWAHLFRVIVLLVIQVVVVKKILGVPPMHILDGIFRSLFSSGVMALAMGAVAWGLQGSNNALILALQLVVGLVAYLITSFLVNRDATASILKLGIKVVGGKPANAADLIAS